VSSTYTPKEHLSCAETAKLVRKSLKQQFPGVKFSVRSDTYSGGASIDVSWTDGPTSSEVDTVTNAYRGADFDGMVDLKSYNESWLEPDGSASLAHAQGTENSRGCHPEVFGDPTPNSRLVSFGADFIFSHRKFSTKWREEIVTEFEQVIGRALPHDDREWWHVMVPLSVDRQDGRLLHMVEHEQTELSQVFLAYISVRRRDV
jgi:hypothetical protein